MHRYVAICSDGKAREWVAVRKKQVCKNVISPYGFCQLLKILKFSVPAAPEVGLFASGRLVVEVAVCQARKLRRIEKCEMCGVYYVRVYEPRVNLFRRDKSGESWNDARPIVAVEVFENLAEKSIEVQFFVDVFCFSVKNCASMPNFSFGRFDPCELENFQISGFCIIFVLKMYWKLNDAQSAHLPEENFAMKVRFNDFSALGGGRSWCPRFGRFKGGKISISAWIFEFSSWKGGVLGYSPT